MKIKNVPLLAFGLLLLSCGGNKNSEPKQDVAETLATTGFDEEGNVIDLTDVLIDDQNSKEIYARVTEFIYMVQVEVYSKERLENNPYDKHIFTFPVKVKINVKPDSDDLEEAIDTAATKWMPQGYDSFKILRVEEVNYWQYWEKKQKGDSGRKPIKGDPNSPENSNDQ